MWFKLILLTASPIRYDRWDTRRPKRQPSPSDRSACAALPGHIVGATDWLHDIWNDRKKFIDKPTLILWGLRDIAFRKKELEYWKAELTNFKEHTFEDCGHFLAEEAPEKIIPALKTFMVKTLS